MTRRYTPTGDLLATVLAGRIDALENDLQQLTGDVTAVGRGVTDLTTQIRHLTAATSPGDDDPEDQGDEVTEGQLDWFAVDDPEQARDIITALTGWAEAVLAHHGITLPGPCWPLHPSVVVDLLALNAERAAAYTGPKPTPVSEFLARWLPATRDRITEALTGCANERGHCQDGRTYDTTGFDPLSAAAWWATDRATPAPEAFALTPLR